MAVVACLLTSAVLAAVAAQPADFSGTWRLSEQETAAPRRRGHVGNFEEPVVITQTPTRLSVAVQSVDPTGKFEFDLNSAPPSEGTGAHGPNRLATSRWEGATLVTRGRRPFTTTDGPRVYEFDETRRLSTDGRRMFVETRITMFPRSLVRRSVYERAP